MATELTTPVSPADITHQAITRVEFRVPHTLDAETGDPIINRDAVVARYEVITYDENKKIVSTTVRTVPLSEWPPAFKTEAQEVYAMIASDARSNGLLGEGTDESI